MKKKKSKKIIRKTVKDHNKSCSECGYKSMHLYKECPMCEPCSNCGKKLMQCNCIEGQ